MKAFIVDTGVRPEPFDEPAHRACFAGHTVHDAVTASLLRRGFEAVALAPDAPPPSSDEGALVLGGHVYVSDKCLGDFCGDAVGGQAVERLCLARTPSSDYTRPVSSVEVQPLDANGPGALPKNPKGVEAEATERIAYDLFWVPRGEMPGASGEDLLVELRAKARARVVKKREIGIPIRLPLLGDPETTTMIFPITSTVAAHVEHWVHVLWLNHLAFGIRWMEIARAHKLWTFFTGLRAIVPTLPRLMRVFVRKGRGVKIHPTAIVEASVLGDGVVIGPRATVRNSILGPGAEVGDHATLIACTLGKNAYVAPKSFLVWTVGFEDAVINNIKLQMSVVGRGAATSMWAGCIDAKFQGSITVVKDGERCSTERSFLGSCIGHGAYIGAKVLLQAGRAIPAGAFITMRPEEVIQELPDDIEPGVPMVRDAGTLVPLQRLLDTKRG